MADTIETIQGSVIQHGPHNDRIYLMYLHVEGHATLIATLDRMAVEHGYGKIIAKIPAAVWHRFRKAGYIREALVPDFFRGAIDGLFIAKFFSKDRQRPDHGTRGAHGQIVPTQAVKTADLPATIDTCSPADADAIARFYARAFETYAFPIHRPEYIRQTMNQSTVYFSVRIDNQIAALAAVEIDLLNEVCEMTDFATETEYRGLGLASRLLQRLNAKALDLGMKTAYTIARADSAGMNRVFEKCGFTHAGHLVNNTQIGGRIRSMNVWYKRMPGGAGSSAKG